MAARQSRVARPGSNPRRAGRGCGGGAEARRARVGERVVVAGGDVGELGERAACGMPASYRRAPFETPECAPNLPPVKASLIANARCSCCSRRSATRAFAPFMLGPIGSGGDPTMPGVGFGPWQLLTHGSRNGGWVTSSSTCWRSSCSSAAGTHLGPEALSRTYMVHGRRGPVPVGAWLMANGSGGYPTIGASGAIFGLLLAYGMLFPESTRDAADPADPDEGAHARHRTACLNCSWASPGCSPGAHCAPRRDACSAG